MLRTKGWIIISRNATRDYIDFAALAKHIGMEGTIDALKDFNSYYSDLIRGKKALPLVQLVRQLAEPKPGDLDGIDQFLSEMNVRCPRGTRRHIDIRHLEISVRGGLGGKKDLSEYSPKMLFLESRELSDSRLHCLRHLGSLPVWGVRGPFQIP